MGQTVAIPIAEFIDTYYPDKNPSCARIPKEEITENKLIASIGSIISIPICEAADAYGERSGTVKADDEKLSAQT
jgi:hypothetical protein